MIWDSISGKISEARGKKFIPEKITEISGGCICRAYKAEDKVSAYFIKTGSMSFEAEAAGLAELSPHFRVPLPLCFGRSENAFWLVLEHIRMDGPPDFSALGRGLAHMHRASAQNFGWHQDNFIGSSRQLNTAASNWVEFFKQNRLKFQLALAEKYPLNGERLLENLGVFFRGYSPVPSLLHGDLWRGNVSFSSKGESVLFDPAVYYGDREADMAMTELFGGFGSEFYSAYRHEWPLDPGYKVRRDLYNLYHVLNHLNIFGGSYLNQAKAMIEKLLAEIG